MKPFFLISLLCLFVQGRTISGKESTGNTEGFQKSGRAKIHTLNNDVTVTFKYLTDVNGYNYGAVFYIANSGNTTMGVKWWFEGSVNVNFSPESSGRMVLPGNTSGVLLTTCTSADRSKAWNSGTVRYNWDPHGKNNILGQT